MALGRISHLHYMEIKHTSYLLTLHVSISSSILLALKTYGKFKTLLSQHSCTILFCTDSIISEHLHVEMDNLRVRDTFRRSILMVIFYLN